jgi:hypothetical protein
MIKLKRKLSKDETKAFKRKMESLNIVHGFVFISLVCGLIVTSSVLMYLRSDRSKYDLYRPGQDKPQQEATVESTVSVNKTEDMPVYQDELNDVISETEEVVGAQSSTPAFKPEDLNDQSLIQPELNLNP